MKRLTLITAIVSIISLEANNLENHTQFSGINSLEKNQALWYRELRIKSWVQLGLEKENIYKVLKRINAGKELRDETNEFQVKNWTYEFTKEAQKIYNTAKTYQQLREASTLYLIASYPNLMTKHELIALEKSLDIYIQAEQLLGNNVKKIDMNGTTGILHLPKEKREKIPVVLWTGGVDKPLVTHLAKIQRYVNAGNAVITFDMPGAGLNINTVTSLGKEDAMHQNALKYVKENKIFDTSKISVLGSSGSGVSLMEFAIKTPELKAVVARCAMVDGPLSKPKALKHVPLMSAQAFGVRIGADINNLDSYGKLTIPLSLKTKGYLDGKHYINTPLLVINTAKDPIAMPEDMKKTAMISSNGIVRFVGKEGHCPSSKEADDIIYNFISNNI